MKVNAYLIIEKKLYIQFWKFKHYIIVNNKYYLLVLVLLIAN